MKLAVCSVQKNRGPWLVEWVVFHHLVGVTDFILYLHQCSDDSVEIAHKLGKLFRIKLHVVEDEMFAVQLSCFQHALDNFSAGVDWMAFIDGDEFLTPMREASLHPLLSRHAALSASALAVNWCCFGSSGHFLEPNGLVPRNYRRCSEKSFVQNRHVKSIIWSGCGARTLSNAHLFHTEGGTIDENARVVTSPFDQTRAPSWTQLRVNHYIAQSREYFERLKQMSGAADAGPKMVRPPDWWDLFDRNEVEDRSMARFIEPLSSLVEGVCHTLGVAPARLGGLPSHLRNRPKDDRESAEMSMRSE